MTSLDFPLRIGETLEHPSEWPGSSSGASQARDEHAARAATHAAPRKERHISEMQADATAIRPFTFEAGEGTSRSCVRASLLRAVPLGPIPDRTCLDRSDEALGLYAFRGQGGDWGAMVADVMATQQPPELLGIHLTWSMSGGAVNGHGCSQAAKCPPLSTLL
jgi:hypothetical protein